MTRLSRFCSTHTHTQGRQGALEIPLMTACDRTWCPPPPQRSPFTLCNCPPRPPSSSLLHWLPWLAYHLHIFSLIKRSHTRSILFTRRWRLHCCLSPEFVYSIGWFVFSNVIYPPLDLEPSSGKRKETQSLHSDWLRIGCMILGFYDLLWAVIWCHAKCLAEQI